MGGRRQRELNEQILGLRRRQTFICLPDHEIFIAPVPHWIFNILQSSASFHLSLSHSPSLSTLSLSLALSNRPNLPPHRKTSLPKHSDVKQKFLEICHTTLSDDVKVALRLVSFDSYDYEDYEILHLMEMMFVELNFIEKFHISPARLREWLYEVYKHYNDVPFHNFRHCFCVSQMVSWKEMAKPFYANVVLFVVPFATKKHKNNDVDFHELHYSWINNWKSVLSTETIWEKALCTPPGNELLKSESRELKPPL
jgi:hypothetical protein